jgi:hypothetical protein
LEKLAHKVSDTDKVIVLDDDDLLLAIPEGNLVQGNHWFPKRMSKELADIDHTFVQFEETCDTINDFSGYTMPGKTFRKYFDTLPNLRNKFEDCRFTNFLDSEGAVENPTPFVFRRIWANPRSWKR